MGKDRKKERDRPTRDGGDDRSSPGGAGPPPVGGGPAVPAGEEGMDGLVRSRPDLEREILMILDWLEESVPVEGAAAEEGFDGGFAAGGGSKEGAPAGKKAAAEEGAGAGAGPEEIPRILGDFRILRRLGSGGLAAVYEAEQISLRRRVALKVMPSHFARSGRAILKFHREAQAAGRPRHPAIVTVHSVEESRGVHFIVQELVPGGRSLADRLEELRRAGGPAAVPISEMAALVAETAEALASAHEAGVVHCDVKPSNILLTPEGRPKVSDFGLAKIEDALALSRTGGLAGTPFYMSPEQAKTPKGIDARTDVFSLGVTLYESLTLEVPFRGETSFEVLEEVLDREPRDAHKVNPRVPSGLALICARAMEKNPDHRYQTMAAFAADLRRFLAGESVSPLSGGRVRRALRRLGRRRTLLFTLLAALLLAAIAAVSILALENARQRQRKILEAAKGFVPLQEALELTHGFEGACAWCGRADPGDPSAPMLKALLYFAKGDFEKAGIFIHDCIDRCRESGDARFEREAHYLLAVTGGILASKEEGDPGGDELRAEAEREIRLAGDFEPLSRESLFWREAKPPLPGTGGPVPGEGPWLNRDHFLVHLARGVILFRVLYKGGERKDFEEAIGHFEKVLADRPGNAAAPAFLGRVVFFLARSCNRLDLLGEARARCEEALSASKGPVFPLVYTTLGQICLLAGETGKAREWLNRALEAGKGRDPDVQNVYKGLGVVCARAGKMEEARKWFMRAYESMPDDTYVNAAFADFYLRRGLLDEALAWGGKAEHCDAVEFCGRGKTKTLTTTETDVAEGYVTSARVLTALGRYQEAFERLLKLQKSAVLNPRALSLACLLVVSWPDDVLHGLEGSLGLSERVRSMAEAAAFLNEDSPVCLSALGAAAFLSGRYHEAARHLEAAMGARERWPAEVRKFHWTYDACDLFLSAMARARLAGESGGSGSAGESGGKAAAPAEARAFLERAEKLFAEREVPFGDPGIAGRLREKAERIFEEAGGPKLPGKTRRGNEK